LNIRGVEIILNVKKMKQGLIEKISKNKELPKNTLDVYRLLGYMNYKFGCKNTHINDYENLCLITKSLNGLDWNPEINDEFDIFYPSFKFDSSSDRFNFYSTFNNKEYYYGTFALGFKTRELAEYAGRTFTEQYNKWLIIPRLELKLVEEVYYREIKTMSDVYRVNGIKNPTTLPETKERYYEDLILIANALNGKWKLDWSDIEELKWFPYFTFPSGLRFSNAYCAYRATDTLIGSCLCFKNRELAEYAGKQFIEQYEKIMKFY
jgi:hypothetical protein